YSTTNNYQMPPGSNQEAWWAPYDARAGFAGTPLPDFDPRLAILWDWLDKNPKTFKCEAGIDVIPGSPTYGQPLQRSYAMNGVYGGPTGLRLSAITNGYSNVLLVWEHSCWPVCDDGYGNPVPFNSPEAP